MLSLYSICLSDVEVGLERSFGVLGVFPFGLLIEDTPKRRCSDMSSVMLRSDLFSPVSSCLFCTVQYRDALYAWLFDET